jgi:hypothetical protein
MRIQMKLVMVLAASAATGTVLLLGLPPDAFQLLAVMSLLFMVTSKARPQPAAVTRIV